MVTFRNNNGRRNNFRKNDMQGPDVGEVLTLLDKAAGSSDKIVSLDDRVAALKAAFPAAVAN